MTSEGTQVCDTLRILHLPPRLSDERRNELFRKYGATTTKTIRVSDKYTMTFAKFPSSELAKEAFLRLHQLKIRGQRLSVEFAEKSQLSESLNEASHKEDNNEKTKKESINKAHFQAFLQRLNSWTPNQMLMQPPPPNIRYMYSAPTKTTLLRIAMQLVKEPAFYTQVLHLMNRMNLPPPFEELESEFPMLKEVYNFEKYKDIFGISSKEGNSETEEEESEIETDEEDITRPAQIIPLKRKRPQSAKRLKIPKFIKPAKQTTVVPPQKVVRQEDMFEPVQIGEAKSLKIELKTVDRSLDEINKEENTNTVTNTEGGFGLMFPAKQAEDEANKSESSNKLDFITSEELAANRISPNDQRVLPVFKHYHPGIMSHRLYLKNLSKHVELEDLHFIYRRYVVPGLKNADYEYDIRLMQEGRMKGQAFVTLQNAMQARMALDETNGYILKDKPMVVQFAKVKNEEKK